MPVTTPRIFTVLPSQAELGPSDWMLWIGTMPSAPAVHGAPAGTQALPQFSGPAGLAALKSAGLSSVSCVPAPLRAKASCPFAVGMVRPPPSRYAAIVCELPAASITVPAALRSWMPPLSATPDVYVWSPRTVVEYEY